MLDSDGPIVDYPKYTDADYTVWDRFDGTVWIQRWCPDCDKGLLYAPARFCGTCGGSGYRVWLETDARQPSTQ